MKKKVSARGKLSPRKTALQGQENVGMRGSKT